MEASSLKRIANKYTQTSLILRILIGMAIGVVLALTVPEFTGIKILGDLFVGALKAIAPLLVCLLIMSSLAQTKEGHNGNMKTVVILYMFSTVMGAITDVPADRFSAGRTSGDHRSFQSGQYDHFGCVFQKDRAGCNAVHWHDKEAAVGNASERYTEIYESICGSYAPVRQHYVLSCNAACPVYGI